MSSALAVAGPEIRPATNTIAETRRTDRLTAPRKLLSAGFMMVSSMNDYRGFPCWNSTTGNAELPQSGAIIAGLCFGVDVQSWTPQNHRCAADVDDPVGCGFT